MLKLVALITSFGISVSLKQGNQSKAPSIKLLFDSIHGNSTMRPSDATKQKNSYSSGDGGRYRRWILDSEIETKMDSLQLIARWGYIPEEHSVITEDGYILRIHRIVGKKEEKWEGGGRPVLFLQHGLEGASSDWLTNLPHLSAGFVFFDAGFDVWLGNSRGNTYGLRHTSGQLNEKFWSFTWDEMAQYDLPATIDYILRHSNRKRLYYVGHSQGTLTVFALVSQRPEYAEKIKKIFALAPIGSLNHIKGLIKFIQKHSTELTWLYDIIGPKEFAPRNWLSMSFAQSLCGWKRTSKICNSFIFLLCGPDSNQLNQTRLPVFLSHTPAGTSSTNIIHYSQVVTAGKLQKFDFGKIMNAVKYGTAKPPFYNFSNVNVDTYLFWGDHDWLATPKDIKENLLPVLPQIKETFSFSDFNHLDFIWGSKAASDIYAKIINQISSPDH